jgi:acyl-CoA synthetase (NDP forming)
VPDSGLGRDRAEGERDASRWEEPIARCLRSSTVTIVGANAQGGTTSQILAALARPECPFEGRVQLVNRRGGEVNGLPVATDIGQLTGDIGILWLLVGPDPALGVLDALEDAGRLPAGVLVFADGFGEVDGQPRLAAWSVRNRVPLFGPQCVGIASLPEGLYCLDFPVAGSLVRGDVALLGQSGGVMAGLVNALVARGVGVDSVYTLGNQAIIDFLTLGEYLLGRETVASLAIYAESVPSLPGFARLAWAARTAGKPIILNLGGQTDLGHRIARSHTGALATDLRLLRGISEQYGVVLVRDPDELASSVDALQWTGYKPAGRGRVGAVSGSGGGTVIVSDVLTNAGLRFPELAQETRERLKAPGLPEPNNPYDTGAGLLGKPEEWRRRVSGLASDPGLDIIVHVVGQLPAPGAPVHVRMLDIALEEISANGKLPVVLASRTTALASERTRHGVVICSGYQDAAVKVGALSAWARPARTPPVGSCGLAAPLHEMTAASPDASVSIVSGAAAQEYLADLLFAWPGHTVVEPGQEVSDALAQLKPPFVLKAQAGTAHRARVGAVLDHVPTLAAAIAGTQFLHAVFDAPVEVSEFVAHDGEYFAGLSRHESGLVVMALGPGGTSVGAGVGIRLLPLSRPEIEDFVRDYLPAVAAISHAVTTIRTLQEILIGNRRIAAIDINPIVIRGDQLVVLDAKVHLYNERMAR